MIDDWHTLIFRLWSVRVALFWAAFMGLYMALPAFTALIDPFWFAGICVFATITVVLARLTKQPGID